MEYRCSVFGCPSIDSDRVQLHQFPFDNQSLLPSWIMATNRLDWLPGVRSRICDKHFSDDDYEGGSKKNKLKPTACPVFNGPSNNIKVNQDTENLDESSDVSSTSDINSSDMDFDDLQNYFSSPDNSVIKVSDDDSSLISMASESSNSNEATGLDENYLSSPSSPECDEEDMEVVDESSLDLDTVSLSSTLTSSGEEDQFFNQKCAVLLCNDNARNRFDTLFFLDFPKNPVLRNKWWKMCGRNDTFDPTSKICSIHFDVDNFEIRSDRRDGQLYRQTVFKNPNPLPTLYLQPHEYTLLTRKRKLNSNDHKTYIPTKYLEEDQKCLVTSCQKFVVKDCKTTLFFRFPLNNPLLLKRWLDNIQLPNLEPLESDKICSDHFDSSYIKKFINAYELTSNAIPSIHPESTFFIDSEKSHKNNKSVKEQNKSEHYSSLKFNSLNDFTLEVKDTERPKFDAEGNMLNTLKNKIKDQQQQKEKIVPITVKDQSNSTEQYTVKDELLNAESNSKINLNNTNNNVSPKHKKKSSQIELTQTNLLEDTNIKPKSKNSGNDCDYVYLDTLQGNDAKKFLSFERKLGSNISKTKIPDIPTINQKQGTPKSIIYNEALTESYGEMLPAYCGCPLTCYYSIPGPQRSEIFKEFHLILNLTEQNCKIAELTKLRMIKKANGTFESYPSYTLMMNKESVKVCRKFFMNTLGIPESRLDAILEPNNYGWFSNRVAALKANIPKQVKIISESIEMTDFVKESLVLLEKDYNLYEPESDSEVSLENVPDVEYEKVFLFMKSIPRVLSSCRIPEESRKQFFETSIRFEVMYKMYSGKYIKDKIPIPYTKCQFKKIYNQYMKTFLKRV